MNAPELLADDLAYELRTPVNILLGKNQVMLSQERSAEEYQQSPVDTEELQAPFYRQKNILFGHARSNQNIAGKNSLLPALSMR